MEKKRDDIDIIWVDKEDFNDEELPCFNENDKIYEVLDFSGDWLSAITIFNTKRHINLAALLWGLGELTTDKLLFSKDPSIMNTENSLISKMIGWGYACTSLLYARENDHKRQILTTLKRCELSESLIREIL